MIRRRCLHRRKPCHFGIVVFLGVLFLFLLLFLLDYQLRPRVLEIAQLRLDNQLAIRLNEVCADQELAGEELLHLTYDPEGHISAVQLDGFLLGRIRNALIADLDARMNDSAPYDLSIPVGSVFSPSLFLGLGPNLPVKVLQMTCAGADFESFFTAEGINQTHYQLRLTVTAEVLLLLPGGSARRRVSASTIVAETILLGSVPQSYASFDSQPKSTEE